MFNIDSGSEFKNQSIEQALETLVLNEKGTPYDNAIAEATFKKSFDLVVTHKVRSISSPPKIDLFC
ncbi:hypothetical protein [Gracilibacillus xinjiangensis]|uniref:Integrase catalytic domain-containing protein n=1 Tax=Gracilibacillus xinjiangensis TaxID=1193282 RepID=A0ABV8WXA1_9BACI